MLAGLAFWGPPVDVNMIPLLGPLAFLASQGIPTLRRGAAAALDWFAVVTFACCAALVWLGYFAMLSGLPAKVAANFARVAPGFAAQFQLLPVLVALLLMVGWAYVVFSTAPAPIRSVLRWAALGGAEAARRHPAGLGLRRGEIARRAAGGGASLPRRDPHAALRSAQAEGLPVAHRAG